MFKILCPKQVAASVLDIDLEELAESGISALIIDLDNTLLGWDAEELPREIIEWVKTAQTKGFRVCIASNGLKKRVRELSLSLGVPAIPKATKPRKRPFKRALALLGVEPHEAAVVGDQIFTDILGGNRMSLHTILINPISEKELGSTRIVRRVERRVLTRLDRKGILQEDALAMREGCRSRRKR